MPAAIPKPQEVKKAFKQELHPRQQSVVISWLAFSTTFSAARLITWGIKNGKGPFGNVSAGGTHLHHYLWGIAMVSGVGGVALRGEDRLRRHPAVAFVYGAGLALIVDEFALLLDLKDVYWAKQGRWSVDLGVGLSASAGSVLSAKPVLARLAKDRRAA